MLAATHAVFPGTFDPITLGHLDVVRRALTLFERVTVAVAEHHSKSQLLGTEERLELVRQAVAPLERVEVVASRQIPRTTSGKLQRHIVQQRFARDLAPTLPPRDQAAPAGHLGLPPDGLPPRGGVPPLHAVCCLLFKV